jgi:hypothetical protein
MKDLITFVKSLMGNVKNSLVVTRTVGRNGRSEAYNVFIYIYIYITLFKDGSEIGFL